MLDTRQIRSLASSAQQTYIKREQARREAIRRKEETEVLCEIRFTYELHKYVGKSETVTHSFKKSLRRSHFVGVSYLNHHQLEIDARAYGISRKRKGFEPYAGKKYVELVRIDIISTETNETLFMECFKGAEL